MKIGIINGPNLNLLGKREPEIYGTKSFEDYLQELVEKYPTVTFEYFQSNDEKALVGSLQEMKVDGIILNAGAFTHSSIALGDAVMAISTKVVEVHISQIYKREKFRHHSYITAHSAGLITGFGLEGYRLALESFLK